MNISFRSCVEKAARRHGLPLDIVLGIIETESGGDYRAIRYEPHYRWLVDFSHPSVSAATETMQQKTSWGPMQVMGAVAREHGFEGPFLSALCEPAVGVEYGCRLLARLIRLYRGTVADAVSAYNQGSAKKNVETGEYRNQQYVDKVMAAADRHMQRDAQLEREKDMSVFSVLKGIAGTALKVGRIALPIIRALRASSEEVDQVCDQVEDVIDGAGEAADDFFDRNMSKINALEEFAVEGQEALAELEGLCGDIRRASQVETPDMITPEEGKRIAARLPILKDRFKALVTKAAETEDLVTKMA